MHSHLCLALVMLPTGLLFFLLSIAVFHPVHKEVNIKLVGESGRGTAHHVCNDEEVKAYGKVPNFLDEAPTYLDYYFFSIENPKEYLSGTNAEVVEYGPFVLRKFDVSYDISLASSRYSENPTGAIEFSSVSTVVVLDKDTQVTSTLSQDNADNSLLWSSDARTALPKMTSQLPSHISMSDKIMNLSPSYISLLGDHKSELSMVLSFTCSPNQIENIASAKEKKQCTEDELLDSSKNDCACCMQDEMFKLLTEIDGAAPAYVNCNDILDETNDTMSFFSLMATYDGGVPVKDKGDGKLNGSGETFTKTAHGQEQFNTPLIQAHSINDVMFGYPSALMGKLVPKKTIYPAFDAMIAAGDDVKITEIAAKALKGELDNTLATHIGNLAKYTSDVGKLCASTCTKTSAPDPLATSPFGWMCDGNAPERHNLDTIDDIVLGGIDCKPFSATFVTEMYCSEIANELTLDPNAIGYEACVCADGTSDWSDGGCCLAGGKYDGMDLMGTGCLYPIDGIVGPNFVGKDEAPEMGVPKVDIGNAMKAIIDRELEGSSGKFMCPAPGAWFLAFEQMNFGFTEKIEGETVFSTYYDTGNPRVLPTDALTGTLYNSTINGGDGTMGKALGWTDLNRPTVNFSPGSGKPHVQTYQVYLEDEKQTIQFDYDFFAFARLCGTDACIKASRFRQSLSAFSSSVENATTWGQGTPYDGVRSLGPLSNAPAYLHAPFYLDGDVELLSQQNNTHVDAALGNGINIYRGGRKHDEYSNAADPGAFLKSNSNYVKVDATYLAENHDHLESYFDFEPASGLTFDLHMRYGKSYSVWECDPATDSNCALGKKTGANAHCYRSVGQTDHDSLEQVQKDAYSKAGIDDFAYPCSTANVFSPHLVGGKIMPMHWHEKRMTVSAETIDSEYMDMLTNRAKVGNSMTHLFHLGLIFIWLGIESFFGWVRAIQWETKKVGAVAPAPDKTSA
mmetsp:Transcript_51125/g.61534  ORF Transcript_51125/g.61534 Transcript_51125/m.61534 type:complete len:962 (+) Transcript_51125:125-3010(+)